MHTMLNVRLLTEGVRIGVIMFEASNICMPLNPHTNVSSFFEFGVESEGESDPGNPTRGY